MLSSKWIYHSERKARESATDNAPETGQEARPMASDICR
jgi:hypothetical protein